MILFYLMKYFAAQVQTLKEDVYIERIKRQLILREEKQHFFFPKRRLTIRRQGKQITELQPIFPGYIFIETDDIDFELRNIMRKTPMFYRFLKSNQEIIPLQGNDLNILKHFLDFGPVAEISQVYFDENDRIVVTDGPLAGLEGSIIRVDKRKQRAKVQLDFANNALTIDLSFTVIHKSIGGTTKAFLDDDPNLIGQKIDGIPVLGPIDRMVPLLKRSERDEVIIAMPTAPIERIRGIYTILTENEFEHIKIVPSVSQIVEEDVHLIQTREIDPLDILGRTPVTISLKESLAYLRGKRVLITGAGGSIGSELARQLLSGGAARLYLFGHGENSIYQIDRELRLLQNEGVGEKTTIVPVIGEMKDREYMKYIISRLKCDVIFHCAAYKHVPLMQENPVAVIENNVFGTKNVLDAALENNVSRFVLISTDKAVEPVSIYGISKLLCEKLVLDAALKVSKQDAAYMFVRFGNVLASRGSVLPLFMKQLQAGGPITVTHPDVKRYFMTIPEACSLVLKTGGVGQNGIPYMLDMGEPIRIADLAEQLIRFSGYIPGKDISISYIGLRKGERLEEPLWLPEENPQLTEYPKILQLKNSMKSFDSGSNGQKLEELLEQLRPICVYTEGKIDIYRSKQELYHILLQRFPALQGDVL